MDRLAEALVHHSGADVGPACGLVLLSDNRVAILEFGSYGLLERIEVEPGLRLQPIVEKGRDLEELVERLFICSSLRPSASVCTIKVSSLACCDSSIQ